MTRRLSMLRHLAGRVAAATDVSCACMSPHDVVIGNRFEWSQGCKLYGWSACVTSTANSATGSHTVKVEVSGPSYAQAWCLSRASSTSNLHM